MFFKSNGGEVPLSLFGDHNAQNLNGALEVLKLIGVTESQFFNAIQSFKGASNRLELLADHGSITAFRDFAHAPSKVRESLKAVRGKYPDKTIVAFSELHTYSSLNRNFIENYKGTLDPADHAYVFLDDHAMAIKKMENIPDDILKSAFNREDLGIIRSGKKLEEIVKRYKKYGESVFLFMSSGKFGGTNLESLFSEHLTKI